MGKSIQTIMLELKPNSRDIKFLSNLQSYNDKIREDRGLYRKPSYQPTKLKSKKKHNHSSRHKKPWVNDTLTKEYKQVSQYF